MVINKTISIHDGFDLKIIRIQFTNGELGNWKNHGNRSFHMVFIVKSLCLSGAQADAYIRIEKG